MPVQADSELFRILLYRENSSELLVETDRQGRRLPAISIPRYVRMAQEITHAVQSLWNLKSYCLFPLSTGNNSDHSFSYQVLEACARCSEVPSGMQWMPVNSLSDTVFEDSCDFVAVQNSLARLSEHRSGMRPGIFGKPGWLRMVTDWIGAQEIGLRLTGEFRQYNASPTFSLLRFETDGPALWFKAVGKPNAHEYSIVLKLANLLPRFVPRVVASNPAWNAWLSLEAAGSHLDATSTPDEWQRVATSLASLQIASVGNELQLIDAGCADARVCSLLKLVDPFFYCMTQLMGKQTKPSPAPLTRIEVTSLASDVRSILEELGSSEIPSTLGHIDFNPGNILMSHKECVFLDWAEGSVGHPFFTFQYLLEHSRQLHGPHASREEALTVAYTIPWQSFASPTNIAADLQHTPLVAAFAYATSCPAWRNREALRRPVLAGFLRSLVRRMKREADGLRRRRLTCVC